MLDFMMNLVAWVVGTLPMLGIVDRARPFRGVNLFSSSGRAGHRADGRCAHAGGVRANAGIFLPTNAQTSYSQLAHERA